MNKKFPLIIVLSIISMVISCANPKGFKRTSYDQFENVIIDPIGVQMSLPEKTNQAFSDYYMKIYDSEAYQDNTNSISVVIKLHPYWFENKFTEPQYFLIIRLVKARNGALIIDPYKRFIHTGLLGEKKLQNTHNDIYEWIGLDRFADREYYIFQREIELPDNNMVYASAKLFHRPDINTKEDFDIDIIRKILESIQPL